MMMRRGPQRSASRPDERPGGAQQQQRDGGGAGERAAAPAELGLHGLDVDAEDRPEAGRRRACRPSRRPSTIHAGWSRRIDHGLETVPQAGGIQREPIGARRRPWPGLRREKRGSLAGDLRGHLLAGRPPGRPRRRPTTVSPSANSRSSSLSASGILHQPLDRPLERPRAERRVVALAAEQRLGRVGRPRARSAGPPGAAAGARAGCPRCASISSRPSGWKITTSSIAVQELRPERVAQLLHEQRAHLLRPLVLAERCGCPRWRS